jgi:hypothetical protein
MTLLGVTCQIELTLASRDEMGFRMLLGREAFRGRFLVDASNSYYSNRPAQRKKTQIIELDRTSDSIPEGN